jgi:predicted transposase YbfD/YdcC
MEGLSVSASSTLSFVDCFERLQDPRINRSKVYLLIDILFISVAATLAGADGPTDIAAFATDKLEWCRRFVKLEGGVPSHDTIGRVISLIKPLEFQKAFLEWVTSFVDPDTSSPVVPRLVPIDGKTVRGSGKAKDRANALHIVSAWATASGLSLGQVAVGEKSNEITAIPELLKRLELTGAIVSIDAMGCQKQIAQQIVNGGGDFLLALKDNQRKFSADVREFFEQRHELDDFQDYGVRCYTTTETSRGRVETRHYYTAPLPASLNQYKRPWSGLRSIGQVITHVESQGKESDAVRYYISSRPARVREFARAVRGHWGIESMHWVLDVVFSEDRSRIRNGSGPENFSALRKFVVGLLKRDTSRGSMAGKRKRAAWSTKFLEKLMFFNGI